MITNYAIALPAPRGANLPNFKRECRKVLASAQAAAMRLNNSLSDFSTLGRTTASSFAIDFKNGLQAGETAWQSFEKAGVNALNKIEDKLIQIAVDDVWKAAFPGGSGGLLGIITSIFGGGTSSYAGAGASASAVNPSMYHTGGIVGDPGMPSRYIPTAYFDDAPHFDTGGIVNGEVPIIAHRGEGVFTPGQMAAMGGSKNAVINIFPVAGSTMDSQANSDGSITLIGRMIDNKITSFGKSLPDRLAAINRDPRARG
jgi:hypothetical protein